MGWRGVTHGVQDRVEKGQYLVSSIEARAGDSPLSLVVAGLRLNSHTYPSGGFSRILLKSVTDGS